MEKENNIVLPVSYCHFLETYGSGTYNGVFCINFPDEIVLQEFASYDLWEHKDAPITQEQIAECIALGNSIDGDFFAIHKNVDGLILLPRHSEKIDLVDINKEDFRITLGKLSSHLYGAEDSKPYFEPAIHTKHIFMHHQPKKLFDLAQLFKHNFEYDFLIENEYTCTVFMLRINGNVRFNYATGSEVALFYEDDESGIHNNIIKFLESNNCKELSRGGAEDSIHDLNDIDISETFIANDALNAIILGLEALI